MDIESLLRSTGAILQGHFRLASGRHSDVYIEKFRIMEDPVATLALCGMIADHFRPAAPNVVVGPAMGGVILAYETARQLGVRNIFAEKDGAGGLMFDRGFALKPGQPVLVVDDVLTTGGSLRQLRALVEKAGARIIGIGCLIDRGGGAVDFGLPFFACHRMDIDSYAPEDCELCRNGIPVTQT